MLAPVRTAAPATAPVTLEEAQKHCAVEVTDVEFDSVLEGFIAAATGHLEKTLDMALVTQTWRQDFGGFGECLRLPKRPVASAGLSIKYRDQNDVEQTLGTGVYRMLTDLDGTYIERVSGQQWPATFDRPDAVSVTFNAGVAVSEVDAALKAAILLHVAHLHQNRGAVNVGNITSLLPLGYESLIWPYRRPRV